MPEIDADGRQIWLRAFYGFDPESAGYLGFTREVQREEMISKMKDGDIVLIYGAVDSLTQPNLRSQALGFLEVTQERCLDKTRQSEESIAWKREHGFEKRWTYGIKVSRAWRVQNRVRIKTIAPKAYDNKNRFERTTRAILLESDERRRALSHPVRQVNVFDEPPIDESELAKGILEKLLKPSRGIPPSFGSRSAEYQDGENHLYLMMLTQNADLLLGRSGPHVGKALIKVGRSNDPARRLKEVNEGFPEQSIVRWKLISTQEFDDGRTAHDFETDLKAQFERQFHSQGNEFFTGETEALTRAFQLFCFSKMAKIVGAPGKAKGVK